MSETDDEFVERMALTTFWNDASGGMTVGDFTRLFALARRGAAAIADDHCKKDPLTFVSDAGSPFRADASSPFANIVTPPPAGETNDQ